MFIFKILDDGLCEAPMKHHFLFLALICWCAFCESAVILQYHHVNNKTPANTSISPSQFKAHLEYIKTNNFNVVSLSQLIDAVKQQQPLADKTIAITFDDAYADILTHAKPLLDSFGYPFTVFINPNLVDGSGRDYLSWQQLVAMADDGVMIANHGLDHVSVARIDPRDKQQLNTYTEALLKAETLIQQKTGQHWRYFSYPYGEYIPEMQDWIKANDFVAFAQRSGALGLTTDLTSIPRFPASQPYDQLQTLHDKLYALPFDLKESDENRQTVYRYQQSRQISFDVQVADFKPENLSCYISGLGKQEVIWQSRQHFSITFDKALPVGRVRCNCTAPSISQPGRYYWYSKPWFILRPDGQWFAW